MKTKSNLHFLLATILLAGLALLSMSNNNPLNNTGFQLRNLIAKDAENESSKPIDNITGQDIHSIDVGISVKTCKAVVVDNENTKWFLTDAGIVSFNGKKWILHNQNSKAESTNVQGIALESDTRREQLWMATPLGVLAAGLPINATTQFNSYNTKNSALVSDSVTSVAVGQNLIRWFGTNKGISALKADKWLTPSYEDQYPSDIFELFPILYMATDSDGDTLYVGLKGAGVARVFSNDVDGITGASVYAQWGPIFLPSDTIYSICIQPNGVEWFGTDMGVARHVGQNTLENWDSYTTDDGLINNFVQAIAVDNNGNVWLGTKGGISVFDGNKWKSYTQNDGLISDNVLCIAVDKSGVVWIGTDNGISSFGQSKFISYQ
jgi:ligand-binding sensor domain-containing protein